MNDVYLLNGLRSPIGGFGRSLLPLRATEFATPVAQAALDTSGVSPTEVDRVIAGMVLQDMTESNPARIVAKRLGIPDRVPGFTVNMQCTSGMLALILASQQVAMGEVDCVLVLGLESMSNAPHVVDGARFGLKNAHAEFTDSLKECTLAGSKMWGDPWYMLDVAEHHAKVDGVTRELMDEYAIVSHERALAAMDAGRFKDEIVPIEVPTPHGEAVLFEEDEHPRRGLTVEKLGALRTVREGGTITAGNASGINDGAAAALVCSDAFARRAAIDPLARIELRGTSMIGCDPKFMGYSAVDAAEDALDQAGLSLDSIDLIECNEGFAVQLVACEEKAKWPRDRLNVDGGSIGLGHPVGMSGLRITVHLARALRQRGLRWGLATVPAGSGIGTAVVLEAT